METKIDNLNILKLEEIKNLNLQGIYTSTDILFKVKNETYLKLLEVNAQIDINTLKKLYCISDLIRAKYIGIKTASELINIYGIASSKSLLEVLENNISSKKLPKRIILNKPDLIKRLKKLPSLDFQIYCKHEETQRKTFIKKLKDECFNIIAENFKSTSLVVLILSTFIILSCIIGISQHYSNSIEIDLLIESIYGTSNNIARNFSIVLILSIGFSLIPYIVVLFFSYFIFTSLKDIPIYTLKAILYNERHFWDSYDELDYSNRAKKYTKFQIALSIILIILGIAYLLHSIENKSYSSNIFLLSEVKKILPIAFIIFIIFSRLGRKKGFDKNSYFKSQIIEYCSTILVYVSLLGSLFIILHFMENSRIINFILNGIKGAYISKLEKVFMVNKDLIVSNNMQEFNEMIRSHFRTFIMDLDENTFQVIFENDLRQLLLYILKSFFTATMVIFILESIFLTKVYFINEILLSATLTFIYESITSILNKKIITISLPVITNRFLLTLFITLVIGVIVKSLNLEKDKKSSWLESY